MKYKELPITYVPMITGKNHVMPCSLLLTLGYSVAARESKLPTVYPSGGDFGWSEPTLA